MHNNCVHQHFNASATKPARALVLKTKPMFMFMNMLFQKQVEPRPKEPAPGAEGFVLRDDEDNFNHENNTVVHTSQFSRLCSRSPEPEPETN